MDRRPIGILDSGVGGLSVVREIRRLLPEESIVYFGDFARVPYGDKTEEEIRRYSTEAIQALIRHDVKYVVVACGTASSVLPREGPSELSVPYLGVIQPAVKKACMMTRSHHILLLATQASVEKGTYQNEIVSLLREAKVTTVACPDFVSLIEQKHISYRDKKVRAAIARYLKPIAQSHADTLILGCTHFLFLKDAIIRYIGNKMAVVDIAEETAKAVAKDLKERRLLSNKQEPSLFLTSGNAKDLKKKIRFFMDDSFPYTVEEIPKSDEWETVSISIRSGFSAPGEPSLPEEETPFHAEGILSKNKNGSFSLDYQILSEDGEKTQTSMTISPKKQEIVIQTKGQPEYTLILNKKKTTKSQIKEGDLQAQVETKTTEMQESISLAGGHITLAYDLLNGGQLLTHNEIEMNIKRKDTNL